jgi:hypothetical protein
MVISAHIHACSLLAVGRQFDLQDGVATSQAWIDTLQWPHRQAFEYAKRRVWRLPVWISCFDGASALHADAGMQRIAS